MNENLSFNNKLSTYSLSVGCFWILNQKQKTKQTKLWKKSENCRRFGYFLFLFVLVSSKPLVSLRRKKNTGMRLERRNTQTQTQKILNISLFFFVRSAHLIQKFSFFFFLIEKRKEFFFSFASSYFQRIFCVCANRCSIYKMFVGMLNSCPSTNQLKNPKNFFFQNYSSILLLLEPPNENNNHMSLSLSLSHCVCAPDHFISFYHHHYLSIYQSINLIVI